MRTHPLESTVAPTAAAATAGIKRPSEAPQPPAPEPDPDPVEPVDPAAAATAVTALLPAAAAVPPTPRLLIARRVAAVGSDASGGHAAPLKPPLPRTAWVWSSRSCPADRGCRSAKIGCHMAVDAQRIAATGPSLT